MSFGGLTFFSFKEYLDLFSTVVLLLLASVFLLYIRDFQKEHIPALYLAIRYVNT